MMNDFYQSKAAAALDSQLHPMPNEMKEDAKKNFNMICFGCSFSGDEQASGILEAALGMDLEQACCPRGGERRRLDGSEV